MSKWVGYAVSVNCGEPLGCYQGTILEADGTTITLTKAFRNGFPYPKSQVTLNAADIRELKIIEERLAPAEQTHSTVAISKSGGKKPQRATVCESLQANPSSSGNQAGGGGGGGKGGGRAGGAARTKPIDIQQPPRSNARNTHPGSYGTGGSTPKARGGHERARRRNEAFFGDTADPALEHDFDFEGNLALFDKRALWEEMSALRPDVVRAADGADGKYRHDQNVLGGGAVSRRPVRVPDELRGPLDYATDEGLLVPSVSMAARRRLWEALERHGLAEAARVLLARALSDVALRLVGGGRRLDPRNAHQAPTCVALAGNHPTGVVALLAARLLASHGVNVAVHVVGDERTWCAGVRREVGLLALSGLRPVGVARLPSPDAVVAALVHDGAGQGGAAAAWASGCRAALLAAEAGEAGWGGGAGAGARAVVQALLPAAPPPAPAPRLYLADVAPPTRIFEELGISYRPPFGASSVLALHPADDE